MIERLNPDALSRQHRSFKKESSPLFASRSSLRELRILIDHDLLTSIKQENQNLSPELLLAGLLTHPSISLYRYSDDGPPENTPSRKYNDWATAHEGWATVEHCDSFFGTSRLVVFGDDTSLSRIPVSDDVITFARHDTTSSAYSDLDEEQAIDRRGADALAAQVAGSVDADIYITDRPYLHDQPPVVTREVTILSAAGALSIVSLYLRAQREYIIFRTSDGRSTLAVNRGLFYWVGTRELLPSAWPWFSACVMSSTKTNDDTLTYLGQSAMQRVERALAARDAVHRLVNQPQDNDVADETLSNLDVIQVLLMGALDATARVAHIALGLPRSKSKLRNAGWQNPSWLSQVKDLNASLADTVAEGTEGARVFTILRLLRNSVHGEALQSLAVHEQGRRPYTLFSLPRQDMDEFLQACDALGGAANWGVEERIPGRLHADPQILLEQLFPRVIQLIDSLIAATPAAMLPSVDPKGLKTGPPDDNAFSELNRLSIRWQLGL